VPVYLHDWFGPGRHAKVASTKAKDLLGDGNQYGERVGLTGDQSRVAEVTGVEFPRVLDPVDDLPPATVITGVSRKEGRLLVRGTTGDGGTVRRVVVNGIEAKPTRDNFAEWEVVVPSSDALTAHAEDAAGNVEKLAHAVKVP
jgi:hypothetical protein